MCRIFIASHGHVNSFQRLSKLRCQIRWDFFHVFIKTLMIVKNTCHSIPLFFPSVSEYLNSTSDSSPSPGLLLKTPSKHRKGSSSTTGKAAFQSGVWSRFISDVL